MIVGIYIRAVFDTVVLAEQLSQVVVYVTVFLTVAQRDLGDVAVPVVGVCACYGSILVDAAGIRRHLRGAVLAVRTEGVTDRIGKALGGGSAFYIEIVDLACDSLIRVVIVVYFPVGHVRINPAGTQTAIGQVRITVINTMVSSSGAEGIIHCVEQRFKSSFPIVVYGG